MGNANDSSGVTVNRSGYIHVFSGIGIGSLIGILVGLSLSPVVGIVIGGLVTLLSAFFGFSDKLLPAKDDRSVEILAQEERIRELRVGSFGLACVFSVLIGLFLRSHNILGVSTEDQFHKWQGMQFGDSVSRQLVVYKELGIWLQNETLRTGLQENVTAPVTPPKPETAIGVGLVGVISSSCSFLRSPKSLIEKGSDANRVLESWKSAEDDWKKVAVLIESEVKDPKNQAELAEEIWRLACSQE